MPSGRLTLRVFEEDLCLDIQFLASLQGLNILLIPTLGPMQVGIGTLTINDVPPEPGLEGVLNQDAVVAFAHPRLIDGDGLTAVLHPVGPVYEEQKIVDRVVKAFLFLYHRSFLVVAHDCDVFFKLLLDVAQLLTDLLCCLGVLGLVLVIIPI
jgi:hypothetical protein